MLVYPCPASARFLIYSHLSTLRDDITSVSPCTSLVCLEMSSSGVDESKKLESAKLLLSLVGHSATLSLSGEQSWGNGGGLRHCAWAIVEWERESRGDTCATPCARPGPSYLSPLSGSAQWLISHCPELSPLASSNSWLLDLRNCCTTLGNSNVEHPKTKKTLL